MPDEGPTLFRNQFTNNQGELIIDDCFRSNGDSWAFCEGRAWFPPLPLSMKAGEILGDFRILRPRIIPLEPSGDQVTPTSVPPKGATS